MQAYLCFDCRQRRMQNHSLKYRVKGNLINISLYLNSLLIRKLSCISPNKEFRYKMDVRKKEEIGEGVNK